MKCVWVTEQVCLRPFSTAWLVPKATKCLCEEPHQSPYSVHLYLFFFSPQRAQSALSPSLFLRDSSVFLIPAEYSRLCKRRLVVLVSFLMITHKSGERFWLCPRFWIWFAESRWNPRSSDLEAHTVLASVQMLFELQNLKGCLLPCSILPQTAHVKSGISGSVVTLKDNLRRYELLSHAEASSKNKWEAVWFFICLWFFYILRF